MARRGVWIGRAIAAAAGTLIVLVGTELLLRIQASREHNAGTLEDAIAARGELEPGEVGNWVQALRVRDEPGLVYDLRSNLEALIKMGNVPTPLRTNADGLRTSIRPGAKPVGTIRILGLGDSFMMGYGLTEEQSFLAQLQGALGARYPERPTEIVNAAIGGYNTVQMVATLREKGLHYEPDLVILALLGNDANQVIYTTRAMRENPLLRRRLYLLEALAERLDDSAGPEPEGEQLGPEGEQFGPEGEQPGLEGEELQSRSRKWLDFEAALDELAELRDRLGFRVFAFNYARGARPRRMRLLCIERGFATADLGVLLAEAMRERGIHQIAGSPLALTTEDEHPSPLYSRLIAVHLLGALEQSGVLAELYGE